MESSPQSLTAKPYGTSTKSGMSAGCITAIVFGCLAVVFAIIVIVLYAVNNKTDTLVIEQVPAMLAQKPAVQAQVPVNYRTDRETVVVKPHEQHTSQLAHTPAHHAAGNPYHTQAPSAAPVIPAPMMRKDHMSIEGMQDAMAVAQHSAKYADLANKVIARETAPPQPEDVATFNSGRLHHMVQTVGGNTLQHHTKSASIKQTGNLHSDFHDSDFSKLGDDESHDKLNKALTISAPQRFFEDEATAHANKKHHLMKHLRTQGKVDPSAEEVLALAPHHVVTKDAVKKMMSAQGAVDRSVIFSGPIPQVAEWSAGIVRAPQPMPPVGPLATDGIVPMNKYLEDYLINQQCGAPNYGGSQ